MPLIEVNNFHALSVLLPDHVQVVDALLDVFDAELVGHLDSRTFIHKEVYREGNITLLVTFPLQH